MSKPGAGLMTEHGIASERVNVYHIQKLQYNKLQDAMNDAGLDLEESSASAASESERISSS